MVTLILSLVSFAIAGSADAAPVGRGQGSRPPAGRAAPPAVLFEGGFDLPAEGEAIATVRASCERCDWSVAGREAALLATAIDGRYSQHLMLARGATPGDYRILLGRLGSGSHRLTLTGDPASARGVGRTVVHAVQVTPVTAGSAEALALSMAPILHARPDTIGRFTDLPVLTWYEIAATPRGRAFRYSVIFSNEDGGTPTDRLMATWGRTTDIEFVYRIELDLTNAVVAEEYQGPGHEVMPFKGTHEGRHPLLWVATDNNMVSDAGDVTIRYAPAPIRFELPRMSREAVMDAHPWTYRVMADEIAREGKIAAGAPAGSGRIPDLRRFVFVDACVDLENAALSFGVRIDSGAGRWYDSDHGLPEFRIVRSGCFRGAVAVPAGHPRIDAVRFRAYSRPRKPEDPPAPPARARVLSINAVFALTGGLTPGPSLFRWTGVTETLEIDGLPLAFPFVRMR